ncbi:hypothetical protein V6N12_056939 [Hibiscus sabdariffa]|uniref:Uncharacterized protein n=1 Tax=Hibiscus sabdariffa TaxID=183260 RepID=A0ABR2DCV1_9ROSI
MKSWEGTLTQFSTQRKSWEEMSTELPGDFQRLVNLLSKQDGGEYYEIAKEREYIDKEVEWGEWDRL